MHLSHSDTPNLSDPMGRQQDWFKIQVLVSIVFLRLHPKPLRHTPSYEFTTSFLGVCWGIAAGMSQNAQLYKTNQPGLSILLLGSRAGVAALLKRVTLGNVVHPSQLCVDHWVDSNAYCL